MKTIFITIIKVIHVSSVGLQLQEPAASRSLNIRNYVVPQTITRIKHDKQLLYIIKLSCENCRNAATRYRSLQKHYETPAAIAGHLSNTRSEHNFNQLIYNESDL